ncbi:18191_t:CDS:1, partial [Racocetra persica]
TKWVNVNRQPTLEHSTNRINGRQYMASSNRINGTPLVTSSSIRISGPPAQSAIVTGWLQGIEGEHDSDR